MDTAHAACNGLSRSFHSALLITSPDFRIVHCWQTQLAQTFEIWQTVQVNASHVLYLTIAAMKAEREDDDEMPACLWKL